MNVAAAIACITFSLYFTLSDGHVSLTFPPARKYALDFLDNVRNKDFCAGMTKKSDNPTKLVIGDDYNFTWHLGYAHTGGYKIVLLAGNTAAKESNDPTAKGYAGPPAATIIEETASKPTAYLAKGKIPAIAAGDYIAVLIRDATEWGPSYKFRSCADVTLVAKGSPLTCLNGGSPVPGAIVTCSCPRKFYGDYCQFKDECVADSDCGGRSRGECVTLVGATAEPNKECYCKLPYFGRKCENTSPDLKEIPDFTNPSVVKGYKEKSLGLGVGSALYSKILDDIDQFEVVLKIQSQNWIAMGWRPKDITDECLSLGDSLSSPQEAEDSQAEGANAEAEGANAEAVGANPEAEGSKPESEGANSEGDGDNSGDEGANPEGRRRKKRFARRVKRASSPNGMACNDIVIGMVTDKNLSRVGDYFTRNRDTPQPDEFFGGKDDIKAAAGWRDGNNFTWILFRKNLEAEHFSDHTQDDDLQFVFARGQKFPDHYCHNSIKQEYATDPTIKAFYKQNELKYHGPCNRQIVSDYSLVPPAEIANSAAIALKVSFGLCMGMMLLSKIGIGFHKFHIQRHPFVAPTAPS